MVQGLVLSGRTRPGALWGVFASATPGTSYAGYIDARGRPHGKGALVSPSGGFVGDWVDGEQRLGMHTRADGSVFLGSFVGCSLPYRGALVQSACTYLGEYHLGKPHGRGRLTIAGGEVRDRSWANGCETEEVVDAGHAASSAQHCNIAAPDNELL